MESEFLSRNVRRENLLQYGSWPLTADTRRYLILKYAVRPDDRENGIQPRDMWMEAATKFDNVIGGRIFEGAASSGYFTEKLLERGHTEIVGIDTQPEPFETIRQHLFLRFGPRNVVLRKGDAANIDEPDNSFDGTSGQYLLYHMPQAELLFSELHRVGRPGSTTVISSREVDHFANLYTLAKITAKDNDATMPDENFYNHFPFSRLVETMQESEKFDELEIVEQEEELHIPAVDEGWTDISFGILSYLPLMRKRGSGKQLRYGEIKDYLNDRLRKDYFESFAAYNGGHFPIHVHQGFVSATIMK